MQLPKDPERSPNQRIGTAAATQMIYREREKYCDEYPDLDEPSFRLIRELGAVSSILITIYSVTQILITIFRILGSTYVVDRDHMQAYVTEDDFADYEFAFLLRKYASRAGMDRYTPCTRILKLLAWGGS